MLAKRHKIQGRYRIERVFEKGRRVFGNYFSIHFFPNKIGPQFAVVIPSKLKANAVTRNRIRRRLYEVIRLHANLTTGKKYDMVLLGRTLNIQKAPFQSLVSEFLKLMKLV